MGQNKNESVAALHRQAILGAAESVFLDKGFHAATIDDISSASGYSRRTIYMYFENKEDILLNTVLKGLLMLQDDIAAALAGQGGFIEKFFAICDAIKAYHDNSPQSFQAVVMADGNAAKGISPSKTAMRIYEAGEQINKLLGSFIDAGKASGHVLADVQAMPTVYVLWSSISSLFYLAQSRGTFMEREFSGKIDGFIDYGLRQIINSILVERI